MLQKTIRFPRLKWKIKKKLFWVVSIPKKIIQCLEERKIWCLFWEPRNSILLNSDQKMISKTGQDTQDLTIIDLQWEVRKNKKRCSEILGTEKIKTEWRENGRELNLEAFLELSSPTMKTGKNTLKETTCKNWNTTEKFDACLLQPP